MSDEIKLTPKVINEVAQLIDALPKVVKDRIPDAIRVMFTNSANEKYKYPVDFNLPFNEQGLDQLSIQITERILKDLPHLVEYVEKEPKWNEVQDKKEAIKIMEKEICTNLYNVHNVLAARKLARKNMLLM